MRPREREHDQLPSESSPTPLSPPRRPAGNLSSMVVRPSDSSAGGGGGGELNLRRRGESPASFRRRDESPVGFRRRDSPSSYRPRPQRFGDNQGYLPRAGSISPPPRRARLDNGSNYDDDFEHPDGRRLGQGFRGGRGRGRFRDVSPRNGFGRGAGGRSLGRGYDVDRRVTSPFEGEYVHRNDPNLSPREGDWICGNPRCGNLNFARRTHCNNCDQPRYAPGRSGPPSIRISPPPRRGGYYTSPPRRSPPIDHHGSIRNFSNRYSNRSPPPPRAWGATEDPRDYIGITAGSALPRRPVGRFQDHMRKEYDDDYSRRGGNNWPSDDEFIPQRRGGYDRRPPSSSPRDRWARERSRSPPPPVGRSRLPLKESSFMGRGGGGGGRDDRHYNGDFYLRRGRANDSDMMGRGSGERDFRRSDNSFSGRGGGRGGAPQGMARGRNHGDIY